MNKLKTSLTKACIIAHTIALSLFETFIIAVGIVLVGALAAVVLPVVSWAGNAVVAKAKLKLVK